MSQTFWFRGPKFLENLSVDSVLQITHIDTIFRTKYLFLGLSTIFWSALGVMVQAQILWCEQFNNTSQYQSVCIVLESLEKELGKQNKLLELLTAVNSRR